MIVYRLVDKLYADLLGIGAKLAGGRWNRKGYAAIYLAENPALAVLEKLPRLDRDLLPEGHVLMTVEIPDSCISNNYENFDFARDDSVEIGTEWLLSKSGLCIKVPSKIVAYSYNYVVNPDHADMDKVKLLRIEDFEYDERLFDLDD